MEVKKPTIKSIPYEDFKTMSIWKTWSSSSMKAVQKYWWAVWTTSSTGDAAIRCGRLHLQPVVVELSLWQWGLPGMISPALGLK